MKEWCEYNGVLNGLHEGHTNYWTIIPNTFKNLLKVIRGEYTFYPYKDLIVVTMNDSVKIPELKIVSPNVLIERFKLKDYIFLEIYDNKLYTISKIKELEHPECATMVTIGLNTPFKRTSAIYIRNDVQLLSNRYNIIKNENVWQAAINEIQHRLFEVPLNHNFVWEMEPHTSIRDYLNKYKIFMEQFE